MNSLTYVYGIVVADRKPSLARVPAGLPGASPVRLVEIEPARFLAVANVKPRDYGEATINRRLSDLDWVSRAAVAHQQVLEALAARTTVLPMKLFTIFSTDERALADVRNRRAQVDRLVKRVGGHHEFGVRVILDRATAMAQQRARGAGGSRRAAGNGIAYLTQKKAQRDAASELATRARDTVADLYDRLARRARLARRRSTGELPVDNGPLLLDAAFLIPRAKARSFRSEVAREARALSKQGYGVVLTGPWPPYTFVQE